MTTSSTASVTVPATSLAVFTTASRELSATLATAPIVDSTALTGFKATTFSNVSAVSLTASSKISDVSLTAVVTVLPVLSTTPVTVSVTPFTKFLRISVASSAISVPELRTFAPAFITSLAISLAPSETVSTLVFAIFFPSLIAVLAASIIGPEPVC